jgi:hypothetical protein
VQVRQAAIESRQLAVAASCKLPKVRIGHLSMTDDASKLHIGERHTVRTELVAIRTVDCADDGDQWWCAHRILTSLHHDALMHSTGVSSSAHHLFLVAILAALCLPPAP